MVGGNDMFNKSSCSLFICQDYGNRPRGHRSLFDMLEDCLQSNGLPNKPAVIFNCDETGLPVDPKSQKFMDRVGCKNPSCNTSGSKSHITVLACICAVP